MYGHRMSFFSAHEHGKESGDSRRKSKSGIKHAFASILGGQGGGHGGGNSGDSSNNSNNSNNNKNNNHNNHHNHSHSHNGNNSNNGNHGSVGRSHSHSGAASARTSGSSMVRRSNSNVQAPPLGLASNVPGGFGPMMAFGSPYPLYGSQDYGAPQNELATTSDDETENDLDQYRGASSLLEYSFGQELDSADGGPRSRPFSVISDSDIEEEGGGGGASVDLDENCLGRRITRVSTALSAAGSQMSGALDSSRKRAAARAYLLNYLGERGFLKPKLLSSKNGVSFHVATSGDTVFLPTVSPSDDEYLNHLNWLDGDEDYYDGGGAPNSSNPGSRPRMDHRESQSTISASTHGANNNDSNNLHNTHSHSSRPQEASSPSLDGDSNSDSVPASVRESGGVPYNIAVIMSLKTPMELSSLKAELYSRIRIYWSNGVPPDRSESEEYYTGGQLHWDFTNENYNLYVGFSSADQEMVIAENTQNIFQSRVFSDIPEFEDRPYLKKSKTKEDFLKKVNAASEFSTNSFQAGDYVFIVPVVFDNNIPESIYLPSARVSYYFRCGVKVINTESANNTDNDSYKNQNSDSALSGNGYNSPHGSNSDLNNDDSNPPSSTGDSSVSHFKFGGSKLFKKMKGHLHIQGGRSITKADYQRLIYSRLSLNLIRTPPMRSISTADKPIYINRVWTDSLSYEISFGQKYVPLDADIPLKIKLVPLIKDLSIKRIRICAIEKITYVSKNLEYEFDQVDLVANDPYSPYYQEFASRRKPERVFPLLEIRTREKGGKAMKEEVVENCIGDNLLSYSSFKDSETNSTVNMVEALTVDTKIRFPKYKVLNKKMARGVPPYGIDEFVQQDYIKSSGNSRRGSAASGVIDFLAGRRSRKDSSVTETNVAVAKNTTTFRVNSNHKVLNHTRLNEPKRGLYVTSINSSHINVKHKLEIMLRISKPDEKDPAKQRHFEVLIDTPVHIVSELCTSDNLELPTYAMATMSDTPFAGTISFDEPLPSFEQAISVPNSPRMSPIGSPQLRASYDPDELSIQQLMLSRASTQNFDDASSQAASMATRRYSNIDEMMGNRNQKSGRSPSLNQGTNVNSDSSPTVTFKNAFVETGADIPLNSEESLNSGNTYEEALLSDDEPPTYEEITS